MGVLDLHLRTRFAAWIERRLPLAGLTEAEAGAAIGRRRGWLRRFVRGQRASRDLTLEDASRLVRLLGGDTHVVFAELIAPDDQDDPTDAGAAASDDGVRHGTEL